MTKTCTRCNRELPVEQFWKVKGSNDGRESQCIECWFRYRCRKLKKKWLKLTNEKHLQTTNESALELKDKLISDLEERLTETEQNLRYKEQQIKHLQGVVASLEHRMKTASFFQRIFKTW